MLAFIRKSRVGLDEEMQIEHNLVNFSSYLKYGKIPCEKMNMILGFFEPKKRIRSRLQITSNGRFGGWEGGQLMDVLFSISVAAINELYKMLLYL